MSRQLSSAKVTPWPASTATSQSAIEAQLTREGLSAYQWSNGPGDMYSRHSHAYDKVIYVVRGSITFGFPKTGGSVVLSAGDRLDLPTGLEHDAVVGSEGVSCLEAHR